MKFRWFYIFILLLVPPLITYFLFSPMQNYCVNIKGWNAGLCDNIRVSFIVFLIEFVLIVVLLPIILAFREDKKWLSTRKYMVNELLNNTAKISSDLFDCRFGLKTDNRERIKESCLKNEATIGSLANAVSPDMAAPIHRIFEANHSIVILIKNLPNHNQESVGHVYDTNIYALIKSVSNILEALEELLSQGIYNVKSYKTIRAAQTRYLILVKENRALVDYISQQEILGTTLTERRLPCPISTQNVHKILDRLERKIERTNKFEKFRNNLSIRKLTRKFKFRNKPMN